MPGIITLALRSDTFLASMPALKQSNGNPAWQPSAKAAAYDQTPKGWHEAYNEAFHEAIANNFFAAG